MSRRLAGLLLALAALPARAQTMLDQELRLIEVHSLLAALPPLAPPGAYAAGQAFQNIARRLRGEKVPFMDLEEKDGFFNRLSKMLRTGGN